MLQSLGVDLPIAQLACKTLMSPRTFARRFRAEMALTPAVRLSRQRIIRAPQLLEQTELSLETVAAHTGFGAVALMRHHFVKMLQTTPTTYRRAFLPAGVVNHRSRATSGVDHSIERAG